MVRRYAGKAYPCFHFDATTGLWKKGLNGLIPPLYHLDELSAAADGDLCLYVEGEKDAENAKELGFLATTKLGGAKIQGFAEILDPLLRLNTAVIPDNDDIGKTYACDVLSELLSRKAKAALLPLPDMPKGGDLSDFVERELNAGRDPRQSLQALIDLLPFAGDALR